MQFPAYIHTSHNPKIKTQTASPSHLRSKGKGGKKSGRPIQNLNSLIHLPFPQEKNHMERQTIIIIMRITEVIAEAADHIQVNKAAEDLLSNFTFIFML